MRTLESAPDSLFDGAGRPRSGSFRGPLPRTELGPLGKGWLYRLAHEKRWFYYSIAAEDLLLGAAIVDTTYATSAFAFAYDARKKRLVVDHSAMGHPLSARVGVTTHEGALAFFKGSDTLIRWNRTFETDHYSLAIAVPSLRVDARFAMPGTPDALSYIGPVPGGVLHTTEKRVLMPIEGEVVLEGERRSLDGALGGFDYSHGYLPRHTAWRWAFFQAIAAGVGPIALNLVEGFIGEPECGAWAGGQLFPLGEARFTFDLEAPEKPWLVSTACGAVDLRFTPGGIHAERKELGVVSSRFLQPVGAFAGTLRLPGQSLIEVSGALGVTESQDVRW